jgi:hypothetical protein
MARRFARRVELSTATATATATGKGMAPLAAAGTARPSSPVSVFAEDFSLLIRTPRRMRIARSRIRVLS